jgi:hypothetical protein
MNGGKRFWKNGTAEVIVEVSNAAQTLGGFVVKSQYVLYGVRQKPPKIETATFLWLSLSLVLKKCIGRASCT